MSKLFQLAKILKGKFLMQAIAVSIALGSLGEPMPVQAQYSNRDLSNQDFSGQDLEESFFTKSYAVSSNFSGSNIMGSIFYKSSFMQANFTGANLSYVAIDRSNMNQANFTDAILIGLHIIDGNFDNAIITGADFTEARLSPTQVASFCKSASGINPTTGRKTRETLLCD